MDATVAAAVGTSLTTFKTDALTQLATVVPLGMGIAIAVAILFKAVGWFRGLAKI